MKKKKSSTLTRDADPPPPMPTVAAAASIKPQVPAKPAHIRPGLKPVKIPTVDDKHWVSVSSIPIRETVPRRRHATVATHTYIHTLLLQQNTNVRLLLRTLRTIYSF